MNTLCERTHITFYTENYIPTDNISRASRFETSDGFKREEQGELINEGTENEAVIVKGAYSYADSTGKIYTVQYTADKNGFHPEGDHIKVPPFVPWDDLPHSHTPEDSEGSNILSTFNRLQNPVKNIYLPSSTVQPPIKYTPPTTPRLVVKPEYIPTSPRPRLLENGVQGSSLVSNKYIPSTPRSVRKAPSGNSKQFSYDRNPTGLQKRI